MNSAINDSRALCFSLFIALTVTRGVDGVGSSACGRQHTGSLGSGIAVVCS